MNAYAVTARPEIAPRLAELYQGLRPAVDAETYVDDCLSKPVAEREELAERTGRAVDLLKRRPDADAEAHAWAVRHATAIHQMTTLYAFDRDDPEAISDAMLHRDHLMAESVVWWQRQTGDKIALAAHNGHIALRTYIPDTYPKVQGEFLRERLGSGYLSVGLAFGHGSFNAFGQDGTVEHTLDQVRHRDFVVDLRNAPAAARAWLAAPHTVKNIGATYPGIADAPQVGLAQSYDAVIHLQRVEAARLLT